MTIDILLTVYNGAEFLAEQLRSLQAQTHGDWRLWVRDDGSTDGTPRVVREAAAGDGRIRLLESGEARIGALAGFAWLLAHAGDGEAEYTMFCDADDVWLPGKIEVTLAAMRRAEAECGPELPVLVHTDLRVVDARLATIDPSFWHFQGMRPELNSLNRILNQNTVTGCTAMINRALRERGTPVPPEAVMHDWWLALVASCFGRVVPVPEATILYRQHGRNDTGARRHARGAGAAVVRALAGNWVGPLRRELKRAAAQAGALSRRFGPEMTAEQRRLVRDYAEIPECGPLRRRWRLVRLGTLTHYGLARNIAYVLRA
ncbi:MAG TPA: glycosyltransferase family 2 protein [Longimicrobium sp.]|nr:glycosyltransferase family 2 protein [Longimicrobium sp.]